jgi:tetratricopeptide (TPR) repeat protein
MAKKCYEAYEKAKPGSPAVLNNLGVLYEEDGDFSKAKDSYLKALARERTSELYKSNLKRIVDAERSARNATNAAVALKRALIALWYERDIDNYLPDPAALLARSLSLPAADARKVVQELSSEGYILPVKQSRHKYECAVYRVNPYILPTIPIIEAEVDRTADLMAVTEQITPESLAVIGYDEQLTYRVKKVTSYDLQQLLQRDLREAALSLLTKSYKTTLVMSGSIIEAVLLDRVSAKGISKYRMPNGKNRTVSSMDLGDLLIVAQAEKLIDDHLFHLAQALRGFRNLIHPGVEKRKSAISVTEQNAKIAWDITRKLLSEL